MTTFCQRGIIDKVEYKNPQEKEYTMSTPSFEDLLAGLAAREYDASQKITDQLVRTYPGQAFARLSAQLQDQSGQSKERVAAVRGLGRLKDPQGVPLLLAALADQDAEVRKEAARFLAPMHDKRTVEPLIALLSDPRPDVQFAAITPLGRHLFDPRSAEALVNFLERASENQRPAVLTALSKSDDEQVMAGVISRLDGQRLDELFTYIELVLRKDEYAPNPARKTTLLAQLQKGGALKDMLAALRHADPHVRARAASTLGLLAAPLALDALIAALRDEAVEVRLQAVDALRTLRDERAVDALIAAMQDTNTRVVLRCVDALVSLQDMRTLPGLLVAIKHHEVEVRRRGAYALAICAHPVAVSELLYVAGDPDAQVRGNIAYALACIGDPQTDPQVIDTLLIMLEDVESEVRAQAASALGELGDERTVLPLCRALQDSDPLVIRAVVLALGQSGQVEVAEDLLEILNIASTPPVDRTWQTVQESALYALGQLGASQAVPALLAWLEQPGQASHLLCVAIDALVRIGDSRADKALCVLLEHKNQAVRRAAEKALKR